VTGQPAEDHNQGSGAGTPVTDGAPGAGSSPGMGGAPGTGRGSRELVLRRVRAAILAGVAGPPDAHGAAGSPAEAVEQPAEQERRIEAEYAALPRDYLAAHHEAAEHDIVALFAERAADYRAVVERIPAGDLPAAVARVLADRAAVFAPERAQFIVPAGLPAELLARCAEDCPGATLITDDPPLATAALDVAAGAVTGCAVAIAETGTIVLDHGPGQGRRAVTLVPDFHLVVVEHDQVAADLAAAFARLDPARPHTLISGPSATSDIELVRVEGVHGPRTLHVLVADPR
jgi:L-lactate dehydrogenase complex protein LldG